MSLSQSAYEAEPSNPNYAHTFGWACYKKGFLEKADWHLQEAIDLLEKKSVPKVDDSAQKNVFSYHLARFLIENHQVKEGMVLLSDAIKSGLPHRYEKHARELLFLITFPKKLSGLLQLTWRRT
jgi:hypothetical protein